MKKLLTLRLAIAGIGIMVWGYGQRTGQPNFGVAGMMVMATALLLRFAPARWFGEG